MSCEQDLRHKVVERLMLLSEDTKREPLTLVLILGKIRSFSEVAVATINRRVMDMSTK